MSPVHGLRVVGRIPIVLVEDDGVGGGQVNTQSTGMSAEKEDKEIRSGTIPFRQST